MAGKSSKKLQEHIIILEEKEACLITKVVGLLKQNGELLKMERENKTEMDILRKELGQV